jgi:hypothetical protein
VGFGASVHTRRTIFCAIGSVLVKEYDDEHGDSSIIEQCRLDVVGACRCRCCLTISARALLKDMVKTFGKSGLFLQAFKVNQTAVRTVYSINEARTDASILGRWLHA